MARKKNRGKKGGGGGGGSSGANKATTPSASSVKENAPGGLDKTDGVIPGGSSSLPSHQGNAQTSATACSRACTLPASACQGTSRVKKEQDAFLNDFEVKALQVSTQTPQSEPEVVEKVVEIEKVVEKEVKVMVEDPALKLKVEELARENSELKTQVAELQKSIPKAEDSQRINELEDEVKTVTEKVAHYQTVLADTEALLKSLQASVESEEVTWNKKLTEKEQNVRQLTADKANLELQIKQLETMLEKVRQAEEMDSQLKVLQEQLQKEEKEKASLLEQLQDAQEQLTKTASQSASTNGPASEEQCQEGAGAK